jgi:hypothetical protein
MHKRLFRRGFYWLRGELTEKKAYFLLQVIKTVGDFVFKVSFRI